MALYTDDGRRKVGPPVRFGIGIFWHLLRHGSNYDIVHGASFPYFSVIGARAALLFHRKTKLVVDWHEIWTKEYWQGYLGSVGGRIGYAVQKFCLGLPDHNFAESHMYVDRIGDRPKTRLTGLFQEPLGLPTSPLPTVDPPHVVFAGRHIPEKNAVVLPAAIAEARKATPNLRATIFGNGPEFDAIRAEIDRLGAGDFIDLPGFVDTEELHLAMATASCMVLPSIREGYGLVVLESVCQGTPAVVVAGPDNAASELVEEGANGFVAASSEPAVLGEAITKAVNGGDTLRRSTFEWYARHRDELSIDDSLEKIEAVYSSLASGD
jgi:glycosyltransferase involved in cell wall biosynthesis